MVGHALAIRYVIDAASGLVPAARMVADRARLSRIASGATEVERAATLLEDWSRARRRFREPDDG